MNPEIRDDDVLQFGFFTPTMKKVVSGKSLFEYFLEIDKYFEKYDYPCTLAIVADGISQYPEWVQHIKMNIDRYKIELHGLCHRNYKSLSREDLLEELRKAKYLIEDTFQKRITRWFVPFGRHGRNLFGEEVYKELGITQEIPPTKVDAKIWLKAYKQTGKAPFDHMNFHFGVDSENNTIKEILDILNDK